MGAGLEVEIDFVGPIIGVEDNHFVFVVPQVAEGVEERLLIVCLIA